MKRRSFLQGLVALSAWIFAPKARPGWSFPEGEIGGTVSQVEANSLRGMLAGNTEFRRLAMPYCIEPGVPIGLAMYEKDPLSLPRRSEEKTPLFLGGVLPALEERPRARRWRGSATRLAASVRQQTNGPLVLRRSPLSDLHDAAWGQG